MIRESLPAEMSDLETWAEMAVHNGIEVVEAFFSPRAREMANELQALQQASGSAMAADLYCIGFLPEEIIEYEREARLLIHIREKAQECIAGAAAEEAARAPMTVPRQLDLARKMERADLHHMPLLAGGSEPARVEWYRFCFAMWALKADPWACQRERVLCKARDYLGECGLTAQTANAIITALRNLLPRQRKDEDVLAAAEAAGKGGTS